MKFERYVKGSVDYTDYSELKDNFSIEIPENFNFAYDVVDEYARTEPNRTALVWCDDNGGESVFSFQDLKIASNKTANFLLSKGIKKGDAVMLILRRRYEFWYFLLALHKIGAIAVPATNLLLKSDIEYRTNAAAIKMIVSLEDKDLQRQIDLALPNSPTVKTLVTTGHRDGWVSFADEYPNQSDDFTRPQGDGATANEDIMLLYFTSGTSGYPKMVQHTFTYPLGHIVPARYWQKVVDGGLHLTLAETGWAKAVWGKIYGQWLAGSAVFAYDMVTFVPGRLLEKMERYKVTTFCAPPTVYRYLVRQDFTKYDLSSLVHCTTAGEALNGEIYNKFLEKTGIKMKEGYGQTELTLTIGSREYYVPKSDILFFETYDGKVCAHTKDRMYQTDYKLFQLEEILPAYFVRISKSVIANVRQISSLGRELTGNGEITFKGCNKATYFSRGYYKILKDKIEEVRFGK